MRRSLLIVITCLQCGLDESGLGSDAGTKPKDAGTDLTVLPEASTDGAPPDGGPDVMPLACPIGMQPVDGDFCIDKTEVTVAQYSFFTTAFAVTVPDAGARCSWVSDVRPGATQGDPLEPQVQIDWCDAFMYCQWNKKRLCGARDGGALPTGNLGAANQWLAACSHDGTRAYCYGSTWDAGACNDDGINSGVVPVATFPDCIGGFPGIYDMTGNAREWIDSCTADKDNNDDCVIMGGDYSNDHNGSVCTQNVVHNRDYTGDSTGFRCCWP